MLRVEGLQRGYGWDHEAKLWLEVDVPEQDATVRVPFRPTSGWDYHRDRYDDYGINDYCSYGNLSRISQPTITLAGELAFHRIVGEGAEGQRLTWDNDGHPLVLRGEASSY